MHDSDEDQEVLVTLDGWVIISVISTLVAVAFGVDPRAQVRTPKRRR